MLRRRRDVNKGLSNVREAKDGSRVESREYCYKILYQGLSTLDSRLLDRPHQSLDYITPGEMHFGRNN